MRHEQFFWVIGVSVVTLLYCVSIVVCLWKGYTALYEEPAKVVDAIAYGIVFLTLVTLACLV